MSEEKMNKVLWEEKNQAVYFRCIWSPKRRGEMVLGEEGEAKYLKS